MKESIFITGIAGLLGANLSFLLKDRYRVSGIDRNAIDIRDVDSYIGNVLDLGRLEEDICKRKPDYLIHCAAMVSVDGCEENPDEARKINYELTRCLAQVCERINCKMIFISSDAVYHGDRQGLYKETDPVAPISVYGKTKVAAEQAVLQTPRGLVVRTNIYGYNFRNKNSFGEWIRNSLESGQELNMFYDLWFSPILVNELAEILALCMEKDVCGLYNICATGSISKYDMAMEIKKAFELTGTINRASMKNFEFRAPRTQNMGMDNAAIRKLLNISIATPQEGVARFRQLWDEGYPQLLKKGGYEG